MNTIKKIKHIKEPIVAVVKFDHRITMLFTAHNIYAFGQEKDVKKYTETTRKGRG